MNTWRAAVGMCVVAAFGATAVGCSAGTAPDVKHPDGDAKAGAAGKNRPMKLIGDGSTAYTGVQPHQPKVTKLKPGQRPPQFVVYSWDGAGEDGNGLFSHFRKLGKEYDASMTYFLSGLYVLPEGKRSKYAPPGHPRGSSDIEFMNDQHVKDTLDQVRGAWLDGNEIGTHYNGHFCGPTGVGSWTKKEWLSETAQAKQFVKEWKTNTGDKKSDPLPFDYERELIGGRTPCLEGQKNAMKAAKQLGFRYDSSGVNSQVWPRKRHGIWDLSLQNLPFPGRAFEVLSMDYNYMANQSGTSNSPGDQHEVFEDQMRESLLAGFRRAYDGNRAPLIIGNHFEQWNGGAYMRAVEDSIKEICPQKQVRCVSFRQLVDWLDAQDPKTLKKLRKLDVGEKPATSWNTYLTSPLKEPRSSKSSKTDAKPGRPADKANRRHEHADQEVGKNGDARDAELPRSDVQAKAPVAMTAAAHSSAWTHDQALKQAAR